MGCPISAHPKHSFIVNPLPKQNTLIRRRFCALFRLHFSTDRTSFTKAERRIGTRIKKKNTNTIITIARRTRSIHTANWKPIPPHRLTQFRSRWATQWSAKTHARTHTNSPESRLRSLAGPKIAAACRAVAEAVYFSLVEEKKKKHFFEFTSTLRIEPGAVPSFGPFRAWHELTHTHHTRSTMFTLQLHLIVVISVWLNKSISYHFYDKMSKI